MPFKVLPVAIPHLLSVGYDKHLMHSRALVLRHAGFIVEEAFGLKNALDLVNSDSIDLMILCHTLSRQERGLLISAVRKVRRMLPIVCIEAKDYDLSPQGCITAHNDPTELVDTVRSAVHVPRAA